MVGYIWVGIGVYGVISGVKQLKLVKQIMLWYCGVCMGGYRGVWRISGVKQLKLIKLVKQKMVCYGVINCHLDVGNDLSGKSTLRRQLNSVHLDTAYIAR